MQPNTNPNQANPTQPEQPINFIDKLASGSTSVADIIAPAAQVITPNHMQLNNLYTKTFFVYTYPRYLNTNWLSPVINYDMTLDISMFIYPVETAAIMSQLRKRQTQLESSLSIQREKGMVRDPELENAIGDIDALRDLLQQGQSRIFQLSLYFTLYAKSTEELETLTHQLESTLGGLLIYTKQTFFQMEQGFNSCLPMNSDQLKVLRNLDTASLSTTFPFTSATLSQNKGILYGINRHNNSLILFDRFDLENANEVIFARSGAGKSYAVKLEALRYYMLDTDVIVIDPENEYRTLSESVGGSFINLSLNSDKRINPFDLPKAVAGDTGDSILRSNIAVLEGLLGLMVGGLTPDESGILDKALYETYALKDITADINTHQNQPPLLTDLLTVLSNITGAESMVKRLQKYTEGTFAGLFTQPTNFELDNRFIVFSIRDLEETLRPIGMYLILTYIWNKIRNELKRRILILDEAWIMMQFEDSARFVHAMVKRARKYYLGVSVITQDVEDFLTSQYGRSVINNAAMQILLKQSTHAVDKIAETFNLTQGEKYLLVESDIGEGLFFAGHNHVAIKIIASYAEDQIITTNPEQLLALKNMNQNQPQNPVPETPNSTPETSNPTPPTNP
ncbi:conjugal transfer protein TraC [Candidatus Berkelbacteria bacterium CG_4_10_14_0_8_um_filter_35_9_33_8]|uniref:Conjugal transfer protein TraC n=1 Tax=Candidatus Berkelbacteria bacterium CG_4_10_14_0_2_um_filter_35_9_33_12 TaxID=1974499 RepID=A0A2M7W4S1_9BACT|nr:MAG: conjugal transfer protein TraC [Candidatus Berkelbacteria bacterium CG23_combo_of_CG06-09_8_20_14_all_33_15]PIS08538.1 MAG: conjugal transfer protein TraC [Candidatus Berkelbacteria bacterium CG10_big_fil_rev_8_21_14_0_10_33_10]PIZ28308.1 MAG: conjugal transfer protein TraC [Candidatus Berkelbacteria bacterium CG_4_10_14_0_8_um_filter_35_9_33_8]PJA20667.1 MAG: conjugal transfer protein TraC [Candidatus Berkelbacteria bacterium CG_4_10_14_0_2_um_filter_35_9_33_12]